MVQINLIILCHGSNFPPVHGSINTFFQWYDWMYILLLLFPISQDCAFCVWRSNGERIRLVTMAARNPCCKYCHSACSFNVFDARNITVLKPDKLYIWSQYLRIASFPFPWSSSHLEHVHPKALQWFEAKISPSLRCWYHFQCYLVLVRHRCDLWSSNYSNATLKYPGSWRDTRGAGCNEVYPWQLIDQTLIHSRQVSGPRTHHRHIQDTYHYILWSIWGRSSRGSWGHWWGDWTGCRREWLDQSRMVIHSAMMTRSHHWSW